MRKTQTPQEIRLGKRGQVVIPANVRQQLGLAPGDRLNDLRPPDQQRIRRGFADLMFHHNPLIRHVVRRTREQLEEERDPQTGEPLLPRVRVQLFGESHEEAVPLTGYLRQAYQLAEEFCQSLKEQQAGSGFLSRAETANFH